ncbi:UNVERIFIED_CONTAM: hypothetical protein K2H54_075933 [Gekko kuhli]
MVHFATSLLNACIRLGKWHSKIVIERQHGQDQQELGADFRHGKLKIEDIPAKKNAAKAFHPSPFQGTSEPEDALSTCLPKQEDRHRTDFAVTLDILNLGSSKKVPEKPRVNKYKPVSKTPVPTKFHDRSHG